MAAVYMLNKEHNGIPQEEIISFKPDQKSKVIFEEVERHLSEAHILFLVKRGREMSRDKELLSYFLEPGEVICATADLKIGNEFTVVSSYPRQKKLDKVYIVDQFVQKKGERFPLLRTTTGKELPLTMFVIRTKQQRSKDQPSAKL